jgi:hypothetical protein
MSYRESRSQEELARAYCRSINADPDEIVKDWHGYERGGGYFTRVPRWTLYIGAVVERQHAAE